MQQAFSSGLQRPFTNPPQHDEESKDEDEDEEYYAWSIVYNSDELTNL